MSYPFCCPFYVLHILLPIFAYHTFFPLPISRQFHPIFSAQLSGASLLTVSDAPLVVTIYPLKVASRFPHRFPAGVLAERAPEGAAHAPHAHRHYATLESHLIRVERDRQTDSHPRVSTTILYVFSSPFCRHGRRWANCRRTFHTCVIGADTHTSTLLLWMLHGGLRAA